MMIRKVESEKLLNGNLVSMLKIEGRNPKQYRMSQIPILKTKIASEPALGEFRSNLRVYLRYPSA